MALGERDILVRFRKVVGMRYVQRIDGVEDGADEKAGDIDCGRILRVEERHGEARSDAEQSAADHHQAPVDAVREAADRHLRNGTPCEKGCEQRCTLGRGHRNGLGVDATQAAPGPRERARQERAENAIGERR